MSAPQAPCVGRGTLTRGVNAETSPPASWMWALNEADVPTLRFVRKKPVPVHVWWSGLRAHGVGAMHPFPREFGTPPRGRDASAGSPQRHTRNPPCSGGVYLEDIAPFGTVPTHGDPSGPD